MTESGTDWPELTPVREKHRFDEARLATYLADTIGPEFGDLSVTQFEGGQSNPTYLLAVGDTKYVLRKKPPGTLLKSAHAVDREYRVMTALRDSDAPVPDTFHLCEDESVIGTAFFVMEYVDGRVLVDPGLPTLSVGDRGALYKHFVEVLAALHKVDLEDAGLVDYGRPGNYYERQISRWTKQYRASQTQEIPAMDSLMEWLPSNIPPTDETTLVHGDYRIGNCIIHPTEPRVIALLDWELSTTGHPLADVGYSCMMYHSQGDGNPFLRGGGEGLPTEEEFLELYCSHTGRDRIDNWPFYIVYNLFRSAGIVQGVYKRGLDGNASSEHWRERSGTCRATAECAWKLVEDRAMI